MYNRNRGGGPRKSGQNSCQVFMGLPNHLKCLFIPDITLESLETKDKPEPSPMTGFEHILNDLEDLKAEEAIPAPPAPQKTAAEIKAEAREERMRKYQEELEIRRKEYKPKENPNATRNAMTTLFIGNLNYLTDESRIRDLCEPYGVVEDVIVVRDSTGKSRGYAFVEFADDSALTDAYRNLGNAQLDGRPLIIDVERGRTCLDWFPARLGKGKGNTRAPREKKSVLKQRELIEKRQRENLGGGGGGGGGDRRRRDYEGDRRRRDYDYEDRRRRRDYDDYRRRDDRRRDYDDRRRDYDDNRRRDYDDRRHRDYDDRRRY